MSDEQERPRRPGLSTVGIHGGEPERVPGSPVVPPIVQSATYFWGSPEDGELVYSRYGNNPNQLRIGRKLALLEGTESAVVFASGMGATAMTLLALTQSGDHVVASSQLYGSTQELLRSELPRRGVETTFVDAGTPGGWAEALRSETRVIFIEVPTNPTLRIIDPRPLAEIAASRELTLVCDATFGSPVNFQAASHGIDVVLHSATKYLGGHSDLVAGVVAGTDSLVREVTRISRLYGPAIDPHAAWLLDRGIRTLAVRIARHNENAARLAEWFEGRPEVAQTIYPGLESHPDHETARDLMSGFGGMVSVVLEGGGAAADRFMATLGTAIVAPSLGGVETLVSQPRYTSHVGLSREELDAQGIADGLVRISVGLENVEDLIADFQQALIATESVPVAG